MGKEESNTENLSVLLGPRTTDVYLTRDDHIVVFHDPALERFTNGKGMIQDQNWVGELEHVRTLQQPCQPLARFEQLCELLVQPRNLHIKLSLDIKPECEPERLFHLMRTILDRYDHGQTQLAPRIYLGLWHTKYIPWADLLLPEVPRMHIGGSPSIARSLFWCHVQGFSMSFASLMTSEGQTFVRDAKAAGKLVTVWTVNDPAEMIHVVRWGLDGILTDQTALYLDLRTKVQIDFDRTVRTYVPRWFTWTNKRYWSWAQYLVQTRRLGLLQKRAQQPFELVPSPPDADRNRLTTKNVFAQPSRMGAANHNTE